MVQILCRPTTNVQEHCVKNCFPCNVIERSQHMPQVAEGWQVQVALFSRQGFTAATVETARALGVRLITLDEMEQTLGNLYAAS